jgi:hypothetical protein
LKANVVVVRREEDEFVGSPAGDHTDNVRHLRRTPSDVGLEALEETGLFRQRLQTDGLEFGSNESGGSLDGIPQRATALHVVRCQGADDAFDLGPFNPGLLPCGREHTCVDGHDHDYTPYSHYKNSRFRSLGELSTDPVAPAYRLQAWSQPMAGVALHGLTRAIPL